MISIESEIIGFLAVIIFKFTVYLIYFYRFNPLKESFTIPFYSLALFRTLLGLLIGLLIRNNISELFSIFHIFLILFLIPIRLFEWWIIYSILQNKDQKQKHKNNAILLYYIYGILFSLITDIPSIIIFGLKAHCPPSRFLLCKKARRR